MADKPAKVGAPTVVTPEIEEKLESILKIGGTIAQATSYAGIAERTYYDRQKASEEFMQRMLAAKHYADVAAKHLVVRSITEDKNLDSAKWWLEKREFRQSNAPVSIDAKILVLAGEVLEKYEIASNTESSSEGQDKIQSS